MSQARLISVCCVLCAVIFSPFSHLSFNYKICLKCSQTNLLDKFFYKKKKKYICIPKLVVSWLTTSNVIHGRDIVFLPCLFGFPSVGEPPWKDTKFSVCFFYALKKNLLQTDFMCEEKGSEKRGIRRLKLGGRVLFSKS